METMEQQVMEPYVIEVFESFVGAFYTNLYNFLVDEMQYAPFCEALLAAQAELKKQLNEQLTPLFTVDVQQMASIDRLHYLKDAYVHIAHRCADFQRDVSELLQLYFPDKYPDYFYATYKLNTALQKELGQLSVQVEEQAKLQVMLEEEIDVWKEKEQQLKTMIDELTEENVELDERVVELTEENVNLTNQVMAFVEKTEELQNEVDELSEEKLQLENNVDTLAKEQAELNEHIDVLTEEKTALQNKIDKLAKDEVQLISKLETLVKENTKLNERVEILNEDKVQLVEQVEALGEQKEELHEQYRNIREQHEALQQQHHTLEERMTMLTSTLQDADDNGRALQREMTQLQSLYEELKEEYALSEATVQQLKAEAETLQQKEKDAIADESRMFESFQLLIEKSAKTSPSIAKYPGDKVAYERIVTAAQQGNYEFSHAMVQGFLAAMRSTRFIILKGLSGTGKTSLPKIVAHALGGVCEVVAVQPNWKSKTDLVGFYNHFNDRFMATQFTEELLKAQLPENKDKFYFIVLDEMNLARVEYYFSDFNSKLELEENKQLVELFDTVGRTSGALADYVIDGNKLRIPPNVFFIGTINEDESTYTLSDKIYDRAQVLDFQAAISEKTGDIAAIEPMPTVSFSDFKREQTTVQKQSVTTMMRVIEDVLHVLSERLFIEVGNRPRRHMRAFLQTYAANNWSEQDAVDLQIVSKVVPKIIPSYDEEFELAMDEVIRIAQHNSAASQAVRAIEKVKRHAK